MNALVLATRDLLAMGGAGSAFVLSLRALRHASTPRDIQRYAALTAVTGAELAGMTWWHFHWLRRQRALGSQLRDVNVVAE